MEQPGDEGDNDEQEDLSVQQTDNPLITKEYLKIIDAAIPKYTMKMLMGLSNTMFLTLKSTEFWMKVRGNKQKSKEKHFEFAKELFKIWDADGGGFLDVDEISLPLISLGLSTDTSFVEKLIKSLTMKKSKAKPSPAEGGDSNDGIHDLTFTLKDFVTIFKADRVGERMSKKIKEESTRKKQARLHEEISNQIKM
jgi:hypothetical protein